MAKPGHVGGLTGIVHQVAFRWRDGVTAEQVAALEQALGALPGKVDGVLAYGFGPDLGLRAGNADFAVVGIFVDLAAYQAYAANEYHQALIRDHVLPIAAERHAVQFELG